MKDVYTLCRDHDVPWPRQIALDGKLSDSVYDGSGYPLHFLHPLHSRLMIGLDDLDRVLGHLRSQGILSSEPPKLVSPGVLQAKFGTVKGSGNIQVYPNATGRSGGNARLNCGSQSQVAFHNCACLTRRNGTLDDGKFWDLVSFFHLHELDVLLLAETGVCAKTHMSDVQGIQFDFAFAPRSLPGFGVGALFGPRLSNLWFRVDECKGQLAFRAWVAQCGSALVLLGVAYAPHAGHKVEHRNAYFVKIGAEWLRLRTKFPLATCILMGDMNLPTLVSRSERGLSPASPLDNLFCTSVVQNMSLLNVLGVDPAPTHCRGNVLDLAFSDKPQLVRSFNVLPDKVAGSDHFALLAVFALLVSLPNPHLDLRWVNFHDVDVCEFHEHVRPHLVSLHAWLEESLRCSNGDRSKLQDTLHVGACVLGVILLGTLFQHKSAFGRFKSSAVTVSGAKFPKILREAIHDMRCKRGFAGFKKAHRKVRTPEYLAPEILDKRGHGKAVDWDLSDIGNLRSDCKPSLAQDFLPAANADCRAITVEVSERFVSFTVHVSLPKCGWWLALYAGHCYQLAMMAATTWTQFVTVLPGMLENALRKLLAVGDNAALQQLLAAPRSELEILAASHGSKLCRLAWVLARRQDGQVGQVGQVTIQQQHSKRGPACKDPKERSARSATTSGDQLPSRLGEMQMQQDATGSIRLAHPIFRRCAEIRWSEAKTQDLANVLWAISRVASPVPESLVKELEKRSLAEGSPGLPVVELVACVSALAALRNVSSGLWKSVKTLDTSTLSTRALGTLLWAHATAQIIPPTSLVKKLDVSKMSPQSLANSLWALAKIQLHMSSKNLAASKKSLATQKFKAQEFASCDPAKRLGGGAGDGEEGGDVKYFDKEFVDLPVVNSEVADGAHLRDVNHFEAPAVP
eukprot:Skav218263  [mRNA]  locus=scaffold2035:180053:192775:- [translate_table: standard]